MVKYASNRFSVLWFFYHNSKHTAFAEDALNTSRMNVKPGGKSPVMHDAVLNGNSQKIILDDRRLKGMKFILQKRGIDVSGMNVEDMQLAMQQLHDFQSEIQN